jgi:heat shock protein HtpX
MAGFEAQIAANRFKTTLLIIGFILFMTLLGYLAGYVVDPDLAGELLVGCVGFAVFGSGVSYWASDKIICTMVGARPANPNVYIEKYFIDTVDGLVLACGLPATPRAFVIESPALNAFATGRDPQHSIICVTTGLLAALDRQELEGVIGHEMSHVYNRDILLMGVAAVLVGGVAMFSNAVMRILYYGGGGGGRRSRSNDSNGGDGGAGILMLIGLVFVILGPIFANLLNFSLSRRREFLADATAVQLTRNPDGLISALRKISASPEKMPQVGSELSAMFIDPPQKKYASPGNWLQEAFSTHPPVAERIAALERM